MGLPVVAPPLDPLAGLPGVDAAAEPESFARSLARRIAQRPDAAEARRIADFSTTSSWAARADALLGLVDDAAARVTAAQRGRQRASSLIPRFQWSFRSSK